MNDYNLTPNARALRQNMTDAERRLWRELRRRTLGARFRRQVPIGSYIVDFACLQCRLIIELDGGQHLENPEDLQRDAWLRSQGYRVLRFWNNDVLRNTEGVLTVILAALPKKKPDSV
jgi:very-short-patch-repair endonuclease